jgi:hypothetical protein
MTIRLFFIFVLVVAARCKNKNPTAGFSSGVEKSYLTSTPNRRPAKQQSL